MVSAGKLKFAKLQAIENAIYSLEGEIGIYERLGWPRAVEQTKEKIRELEKEWQSINGDDEFCAPPREQIEFPEYF